MITFSGGGKVFGSSAMVAAFLAEKNAKTNRAGETYLGAMIQDNDTTIGAFLTGKDAEYVQERARSAHHRFGEIMAFLHSQGVEFGKQNTVVKSSVSGEDLLLINIPRLD